MKAADRPLTPSDSIGGAHHEVVGHTFNGRPKSGRVLLIEQHEFVATGMQLALSTRDWDVETNSGPTGDDVIAHAERFEPHCVLLDILLGDGIGSGIDLIEPLGSVGAHVVMLTAERRRPILAQCLEAGAVGWISRGAPLDDVDSTLRQVLSGGPVVGRTVHAEVLAALRLERAREQGIQSIFEQLTQREALVLAALSDGLSADKIAREHFVAVTTVRSQIRAVLQKLGVQSQLEAVAIAGAHRELLPERGNAKRDRRRPPARDRGQDAEFTANTA